MAHWDGANWTNTPSGAIPNVDFNSVHCVHANDCWAVGDNNGGELLAHWDGAAWTRLAVSGALPNQNLMSVYIIGPRQRPGTTWQEIFP